MFQNFPLYYQNPIRQIPFTFPNTLRNQKNLSLHSPIHPLNQTQKNTFVPKAPNSKSKLSLISPHFLNKNIQNPEPSQFPKFIIQYNHPLSTFTSSKLSSPIPKNKTFSLSSHFIKKTRKATRLTKKTLQCST